MGKSIYIQRKRTAGFNLQAQSPDGRPVVSCTRPGKWGNPFKEGQAVMPRCDDGYQFARAITAKEAVAHFLNEIEYNDSILGDCVLELKNISYDSWDYVEDSEMNLNTATIRHYLSGKHLSCWCKAGKPCHVQDVLLPIINGDL